MSNGADYQYILTHLFTQHNKLGGDLGTYLHKEMMPKLEKNLSTKNWDITPYVNVFNRTPFLRKLFYRLLDLLLLRAWHVHREIKRWEKVPIILPYQGLFHKSDCNCDGVDHSETRKGWF